MSKLKKRVMGGLFFLLSIGFLLWSFHGISWDLLSGNFERLFGLSFPFLLLLNIPIVVFKSLQWRAMLRPDYPLKLRSLFPILSLWYMMDWLYPAKLGEPVRLYLFTKREGIPSSVVIANIIVENLMEGFCIILLILFTLLVMGGAGFDPGLLKGGGLFALFIFSLWIFLVLLNRKSHKRTSSGWIHRIVGKLSILRERRSLIVLFWDLAIKGVEIGMLFSLQNILGIEVPWWGPFFVLSVIILVMLLPLAPGRIGTFEAAGVVAYVWMGVDKSDALSLILLFHLVQVVPATLIGLAASLIRNNRAHSPVST